MKKNVLLYAVICLLLFKNCSTVTTTAPAGDCTYNGISRDTLVAMIKTYSDNQLGHINKGVRMDIDSTNQSNRVYDEGRPSGFDDARTIFFKLDTLQQFFNAVTCAVDKNKLKTPKGTPILTSDIGVRIYYTAYPGMIGEAGRPVNEDTKKGHHTLVFVATYYDDSIGKNIDFDPEEFYTSASINSKVPRRLDDPAFNRSQKRYFALFSGPAESSAAESEHAGRNQGELCPPPRGCGTELLRLADALSTPRR
jgi:hypothetical protein